MSPADETLRCADWQSTKTN